MFKNLDFSSIKTPIALLALIIVATESTLAALAAKASGTDFTLLVGGMIFILLTVVIFAVFAKGGNIAKADSPGMPISSKYKYDIFVSSPMAGFNSGAEYKEERVSMLELTTCLKSQLRYKNIFYAGSSVNSLDDFDAGDISAREDFGALIPDYLYLCTLQDYYRVFLVEAGVAIALSKLSIYFVKNRNDLPFLLRQAETAFPQFVKIYQYETIEDIKRLIEKHGIDLFPSR